MDISRDSLMEKVKDMLDDIQRRLFHAAKQKRDACIQVVKTWDEFKEALSQRKMILAPWCDEEVRYLITANFFNVYGLNFLFL